MTTAMLAASHSLLVMAGVGPGLTRISTLLPLRSTSVMESLLARDILTGGGANSRWRDRSCGRRAILFDGDRGCKERMVLLLAKREDAQVARRGGGVLGTDDGAKELPGSAGSSAIVTLATLLGSAQAPENHSLLKTGIHRRLSCDKIAAAKMVTNQFSQWI